jgi:hypothetical protein|tara:strand:+ start:5613 stop:6236 length:624 start_codon:yes stop_codon:yes gene_type:complete
MGADKSKGEVDIHGKVYLTVARRINDFREAHPDYGIKNEVLSIDSESVVVKSIITDETGRELSSGIAEEVRTASKINRTSAVENCETSAVGRALAFFGMAGTEIASADEVAGAIAQQNAQEALAPLINHMEAVRENLASIAAVKEAIHTADFMYAAQCLMELSDEAKQSLWRAPSNGGIWTTAERKAMQADGDVGRAVSQIKKDEAA